MNNCKKIIYLISTTLTVLATTILTSCNTTFDHNNTHEQQPKQNNKENYDVAVVSKLKSIDRKLLPDKIFRTLRNFPQNSVTYNIKSPFEVVFEDTLTHNWLCYVHMFRRDTSDILLISSYELIFMPSDTLFKRPVFKSQFYFLQKGLNSWNNITLNILPDNLIDIINVETECNFRFRQLTPRDKLFSFFDFCTKAGVYAYIENNYLYISKVLYQNRKKQSIDLIRLKYDGKYYKIDKILKEEDNNGLLSDIELDNQKRYTSLQQALINWQNVYILDLSGQKLDSVPHEILDFTNLQVLILDDNNISYLPEFISELKNIQFLSVRNNKLSTIPSSIAKLEHLEDLNIDNNKIKSLPESLGNIKNLRKLSIANNYLTHINPSIFKINSLVILNVANNKISHIPESLSSIENLMSLNISGNNIKNLPEKVIMMPNLAALNIKNTYIKENLIKRIAKKRPDMQIIY